MICGDCCLAFEPCPLGSAQGRFYEEAKFLELSVPSLPSQGCRPGIGCRGTVKGLGAFLESLLVG